MKMFSVFCFQDWSRPWCRPGSTVAMPVETGHEQSFLSVWLLQISMHCTYRLAAASFTSRRYVCIQIFSRSAMEGIKPLTTLLLLSRFASGALHTGSSLLTWDYSKISGSTGFGTNTKFLDCFAIVHTKKKKSRALLLHFPHSPQVRLPSLRASGTQSQHIQRKC